MADLRPISVNETSQQQAKRSLMNNCNMAIEVCDCLSEYVKTNQDLSAEIKLALLIDKIQIFSSVACMMLRRDIRDNSLALDRLEVEKVQQAETKIESVSKMVMNDLRELQREISLLTKDKERVIVVESTTTTPKCKSTKNSKPCQDTKATPKITPKSEESTSGLAAWVPLFELVGQVLASSQTQHRQDQKLSDPKSEPNNGKAIESSKLTTGHVCGSSNSPNPAEKPAEKPADAAR